MDEQLELALTGEGQATVLDKVYAVLADLEYGVPGLHAIMLVDNEARAAQEKLCPCTSFFA